MTAARSFSEEWGTYTCQPRDLSLRPMRYGMLRRRRREYRFLEWPDTLLFHRAG